MKLYQIMLALMFILPIGMKAFASPDPLELEERKKEASLHIIGEITEDALISNEAGPSQNRQMTVQIHTIVQQKEPLVFKKGEFVKINYSYLPKWGDYAGGGSIQVKKGDIISTWLEYDNNGEFSLLLGVHGLEIVSENGPRIEHVVEPVFHKMKRLSHLWLNEYSSYFVILIMTLLLVFIFYFGWRKRIG